MSEGTNVLLALEKKWLLMLQVLQIFIKKTCSEETNGCGSWKYENVLFRCLMVKIIGDVVSKIA